MDGTHRERALQLWGDVCWLPSGRWQASVGISDHVLGDDLTLFRKRGYSSQTNAEKGMEAAWQRILRLQEKTKVLDRA